MEGLPLNWTSAPLSQGTHIVIFLKLFDPETQTLRGINHVYMKKNDKVADLAPLILTEMNWTPSTALRLYEVCDLSVIPMVYSNTDDSFNYRKSNHL